MSKRLNIFVDLDATVCDFFGPLFREYEKRTGETLTQSQIDSWDMSECVRHPDVLNAIFREPGFFWDLKPYPGALAALATLSLEHDVHIVSTLVGENALLDKSAWCDQYVPFAKSVLLTKGHKGFFKGDVLIDDAVHNHDAFLATNPDGLAIGITFPHNFAQRDEHKRRSKFVWGWQNPEAAWEAIVQHIFLEKTLAEVRETIREYARSRVGVKP